MFGSKMMSSGGNPTCSTRMSYERLQMSIFALERIGLTAFVERHDDDGRAVLPAASRLLDELRLAFLQADRVDDRFALNAAQACFDDVPLARVDHHRHARDVGFGCNQVQEAGHQRRTIEHAFVHVDVDDLRAVVDLVACDIESCLERPFANQLLEPRGAGDVGAFADVHEERRLRRPPTVRVRRVAACFGRFGSARGRTLATAAPIAAMCSGVVPQQPPTRLTNPDAANSPISRAMCGGRLVVAAELVGQSCVRVHAHVATRRTRERLRRADAIARHRVRN